MKSEGKAAWVELNLLRMKGLVIIEEDKPGLPLIWSDKGRKYLKDHGHNPDEITPQIWVNWILTPLDKED
jgi:hypothetical protein